MLTKTKIAVAAILLAASAAGASAQSAGTDYEPTGTGQGMWVPSDHPHRAPVVSHQPQIKVGPNTVIENGQYLGEDPDPNVRMMLERDLSWR